MEAGRLDQRVTVQRVTRTENSMNEPEESWAAVGTRWANIEGRGGREMQRANQTAPSATHLVTKRGDSVTKEITTDDRLVWAAPNGSVTLGIVDVDRSRYRQNEIICLCESAG